MKEQIKARLIAEGYARGSACRTANDLCQIQYEDLRYALGQWLNDGSQIEVTDGKCSTAMLVKCCHMTYPAALIFIDWYRSDPVAACATLLHRM